MATRPDPDRLTAALVAEFEGVMADWGTPWPPPPAAACQPDGSDRDAAQRVLARYGITRKEGAAAQT